MNEGLRISTAGLFAFGDPNPDDRSKRTEIITLCRRVGVIILTPKDLYSDDARLQCR